jgi:hypothetical protein
MHLHNDYAKFMQSNYAKFMQTVVPLRLQLLSAGGGVETCPATCCQTPNQRSPDLPTGRVGTAGLCTARRGGAGFQSRLRGVQGISALIWPKCAQKK